MEPLTFRPVCRAAQLWPVCSDLCSDPNACAEPPVCVGSVVRQRTTCAPPVGWTRRNTPRRRPGRARRRSSPSPATCRCKRKWWRKQTLHAQACDARRTAIFRNKENNSLKLPQTGITQQTALLKTTDRQILCWTFENQVKLFTKKLLQHAMRGVNLSKLRIVIHL